MPSLALAQPENPFVLTKKSACEWCLELDCCCRMHQGNNNNCERAQVPSHISDSSDRHGCRKRVDDGHIEDADINMLVEILSSSVNTHSNHSGYGSRSVFLDGNGSSQSNCGRTGAYDAFADGRDKTDVRPDSRIYTNSKRSNLDRCSTLSNLNLCHISHQWLPMAAMSDPQESTIEGFADPGRAAAHDIRDDVEVVSTLSQPNYYYQHRDRNDSESDPPVYPTNSTYERQDSNDSLKRAREPSISDDGSGNESDEKAVDSKKHKKAPWGPREARMVLFLVYYFVDLELKSIATIAQSCGIKRTVRAIGKKLKRTLHFEVWSERAKLDIQAKIRSIIETDRDVQITQEMRERLDDAVARFSDGDRSGFPPLEGR